MRFGRLDLNLLVALDALLTERSVSLAADRLCLSQSATSSALGRLRDYFGDELLVIKGRQMVLTARAEELIEPVRDVLEQIRATITVAPPFDPATAERQISIMASDYSTQVLLTEALAAMEKTAPGIRFEIQPMNDNPIDMLERGYVDLLLTIDYAISTDHPSQFLFEDDYVVLGWQGNPAMQGEMTRERYFALGHVTARFGKSRVTSFDDWFVRRQKQQRRVEVVAPTFLSLAGLVINSNRIATVHRRMAEDFARHLPLVMRETPFDIPPIRETVQWHITNTNDAALRWVVEQLAATAQKTREGGNVVHFADTPTSADLRERDKIEYEFRMNSSRARP
ncbi:LysR family transcriptional regulator [Novosphingobium profundi]|uniref:LysR family transcriptional regulator n=1 Tax=Novosphingobium profundi TaxID=1774954 RepID=UPI001BDB0090|nr:LysR family transcriptional regulator [Novosphingobium profundi]MBT0668253.1 LysR family transcriptional regulator [Novosphingobium profundi]